MTFLELCQMVSRESGTITGVQPTSVLNQTGRLAKVVHWTQSAWRQIQNDSDNWRWMWETYGDQPGHVTTAGAGKYTAASWAIDRFARWHIHDDPNHTGNYHYVSIYDPIEGMGDETVLTPIDYTAYRRMYDYGEQRQDRPVHVAVSPRDELCFGPIPDKAYRVRGEFYQSPQELTDNDDVPDFPARFHEVIAHYGLILLAEHDEGEYHTQVAYRRYSQIMGNLRRDQLPKMRFGPALA